MRRAVPILLACVACNTLPREPRNPVVLERSWGVATGQDPEQVGTLADVVDAARLRLAEVPGFVDRPLRIHVFPGPLPRDWAGITVTKSDGDGWVAIERDTRFFEHSVVHELAHFYLGSILDRLPPVLEEGFCDVLATRIHPTASANDWQVIVAAVSYLDRFSISVDGPGSKARLGYLVQEVPSIELALTVNDQEFPFVDERARAAYYGIGFVIASSVGIEGLIELDARREREELDHVPIAWIMREAGLVPLTQASLTAAFARTLGKPWQPGDGPLEIWLADE